MRIAANVKTFVSPLVLSCLMVYGMHHLWTLALGMWAAKIRPLFVSAAHMAELSSDALGPWFGLEFALLAIALLPLFRFTGRHIARALPVFLAAAILLSQVLFVIFARDDIIGRIPWSSDQPSFLFRLHEVRATFPHLGGWNPWWNGGTEHFISATSGTHGYAVLVAPLLALFEPHVFHAPVLFFWLWIGFPWLAALGVRAAGARPVSALTAAALMECYCRSQTLFGWRYGILGGLVTAGLSVPLGALCYRLVVQRRGGWGTAIALGVVAWLSCLWTPGYVTCAGLALGVVANAGRWTRRSFKLMLVAAAVALALLAPWIWVTLGPAKGIVDFASTAKEGHPFAKTLLQGLLHLLRRLMEWHPVILSFGFVGLAFCGLRRLRRLTMPVLLVIACVLVYYEWNSRSQCYRVIFQGAAFAVFPASILAGRLIGRNLPRQSSQFHVWLLSAAKAATLSAILLGLRVAGVHAMNCGAVSAYVPADAQLMQFVDWIRDNVPEEGRLAFAGETSNSVGGGTVAYLPILTGREMMSDDYYTFPIGLTSRNYPPAKYRKSVDAFLEFSRLYGITHWAVVDKSPRKLGFYLGKPDCGGRAGVFKHVGHFKLVQGKVDLFAILGTQPPSRFLKGEGRITSHENHIIVQPSNPSTELLVLRYNWREGFVCKTPGVSIEPYDANEDFRFLAIRPNGAQKIEIGYRPSFRPLAPNFDGAYHH